MARPVKHDERTRDALVDAAEALLADGGAAAVTVRAVAERVGESTRAVYSVFGSRAALMGAVAARGFQLVADRVDALPVTDDPLADLVTAGVYGFRPFALERPHLFRITYHDVSEEIFARPEAIPALMASYRALATRIERAVAAGLLPDRPVAEYVFSFHSFTCGLAVNELSRQPPPIGASFWRRMARTDMGELWQRALTAYVVGLGLEADRQPQA
ncbi:MAG: TetR/AcrR family transcriptional regulator [Acidimicrobiales bacterium]